jgi:TrmH family RNA methyltransferase
MDPSKDGEVYTRLSRGHAEVRRLRLLRRDRAARAAQGLFVAEGIHLAEEALRCRAPLLRAVVTPALGRSEEGRGLLRAFAQAGVPVGEVDDTVMDGLQDARSPQPVLVVVRLHERRLEDVVPGRAGTALVAVAAGVQDPGNLGALLRSADAAGATGFVALADGADLHHPRAVRGSMGSIFRLPARAEPRTGALLDRLRSLGVDALATDPAAELRYDLCDLTRPVALFFGAEGRGVPAGIAARLDGTVRVPMHPGVDSLSVGAAAAVHLFEAARQRQDRTGRA